MKHSPQWFPVQGSGTPVRRRAGPHLFGDASFAIYLSRPFTLGALGWAWSRLALETVLPGTVFIVTAMLISAADGILFHLAFEKLLVKWLRNRTLSRNPPQVVFRSG